MITTGKVAVFFGMLVALLGAGRAFGDDEVILKSRRFTPAVGVGESLRAGAGRGSERIHVILQLEGVPTADRRVGFVK